MRVLIALMMTLFVGSAYAAAPDVRISDENGTVLNINSDGSLPVTFQGDASFPENVTVNGTSNLIGDATFNNTTTTGTSSFTGDITASGNATINQTLTVQGTSNLGMANSGGLQYEMVTDSAYNRNSQNVFASGNLVTYNGSQYIAFYDNFGNVTLGKRPINGVWTKVVYDNTSDRPGMAIVQNDAHNMPNLAFDKNGFGHFCWDMHNTALRYKMFSAAENISNMTGNLTMLGTNETSVSYPTFFNDNNNELYFMFRNGSSTNGTVYLRKYNATSLAWEAASGTSAGGLLFDGLTNQTSPYFFYPTVDTNNNVHLAATWRNAANISDADISYVKYNITAGLFYKANGTAQTVPILRNDSDKALIINDGQGLFNMQSLKATAVDTNKNPYIAYVRNDTNGNTNLYVTYWNGTAWSETPQITQSYGGSVLSDGDANSRVGLPNLFIDNSDNVRILYRDYNLGNGILAYETKTNNINNWSQYSIFNGYVGSTKISIDYPYYKSTGIIEFLVSPVKAFIAPSLTNSNATLGVVKWIPSTGAHVYTAPSQTPFNKNYYLSNEGTERLTKTSASSSSTGATYQVVEDDGAAMGSTHRLGGYQFGAATDSNGTIVLSGAVEAYTNTTWNATSCPTNLRFFVTPKGSTTKAAAVEIKENGLVGIGNLTPTSALDVNGTATLLGLSLPTAGIVAPAATNFTLPLFLNVTGSNTSIMGAPTTYINITVNGTAYKIPAY